MFRSTLQRAARLLQQRRNSSAAETASAGPADDARVMAYALGALSAIPFICLTPRGLEAVNSVAASCKQPPLPLSDAHAAQLQLLYGASILSFLGAPHWGLAFATGTAEANVVRLVWGGASRAACGGGRSRTALARSSPAPLLRSRSRSRFCA